ncbi:DUF4333 domain-containing protein [Allokutzneria oryzae]|uniref:DUF4333 domain-containing protein n=1 Tax=Allokutzneria oryzae TaxID=1378989 RepID=A0ABV5ZRG9_9PSEU
MTSPYGPPGGNDPNQQQWGQQPYGGGYGQQGTPSGGFPQQPGGPQQGQPVPGQQQPGGYDPNQGQFGQQPGYGQQPQQPGGFPPPGYPQQGQPGQFGQPGQQQGGYPQQPGGPQQGYPGQQQGQPGQFGQNPYGAPQQQGGQKKSKLPIIIGAVAVVLVAAVGVTGFVYPGFLNTKVFDSSAMQNDVKKMVTERYGQKVESVTCPSDKEVKVDATFECKAKIDGKEKTVPITVKTAEGKYEVGYPK